MKNQYISGLSDAYLQNFVAHASLEESLKKTGDTKFDEIATAYNWEITSVGSDLWKVKCKTNDENRAITGILFYKSKKLPPIKIMVDGLEYRRTSDPLGDYYLYYTKALGGSPGRPIVGFHVDEDRQGGMRIQNFRYCG